jgi:hypothetical protein
MTFTILTVAMMMNFLISIYNFGFGNWAIFGLDLVCEKDFVEVGVSEFKTFFCEFENN